MSDSSDEELDAGWIPYSERNEWKDVVPLAQDDGESPVVAIAYSAKFREIYDYIRAILARGEKSTRALQLTKDALRLNPANYTVWQYRRDILRELGCDLYEELRYIENVITENAKNYQVWHHRRVIVEILNDPSMELDLTELALSTDEKNYHAWQHRQWAIRTFNLYDNELAYVNRLISEDIRNNSAWNQRFFVVKHFGFTPEAVQRELQYAMNRIRIVKNNESSWNFVKGILRKSGSGQLDQYPEVIEFCEELYNNNSRSPYLLAFLIDVYAEKSLRSADIMERETFSRKVYSLCDDMSKKYDVIRRKYWQYFAEQLKSKLSSKHL